VLLQSIVIAAADMTVVLQQGPRKRTSLQGVAQCSSS